MKLYTEHTVQYYSVHTHTHTHSIPLRSNLFSIQSRIPCRFSSRAAITYTAPAVYIAVYHINSVCESVCIYVHMLYACHMRYNRLKGIYYDSADFKPMIIFSLIVFPCVSSDWSKRAARTKFKKETKMSTTTSTSMMMMMIIITITIIIP